MENTVTQHQGERTREAVRPLRGRARTCVGCGERVPLDPTSAVDLVRLALGPDGALSVDARGGAAGRGLHVHARPACLARAARGGVARSTKGRALRIADGLGAVPAGIDAESLARAIQVAMDRRIEGLVAAAVRSRRIAPDAAEAGLLVVARDAADAAAAPEVQRAVAEGRAVAWGDRSALARLGSRAAEGEGRAILAIAPGSIAGAVRRAVQIGAACRARADGQAAGRVAGEKHERARSSRSRRAIKDDRSDG